MELVELVERVERAPESAVFRFFWRIVSSLRLLPADAWSVWELLCLRGGWFWLRGQPVRFDGGSFSWTGWCEQRGCDSGWDPHPDAFRKSLKCCWCSRGCCALWRWALEEELPWTAPYGAETDSGGPSNSGCRKEATLSMASTDERCSRFEGAPPTFWRKLFRWERKMADWPEGKLRWIALKCALDFSVRMSCFSMLGIRNRRKDWFSTRRPPGRNSGGRIVRIADDRGMTSVGWMNSADGGSSFAMIHRFRPAIPEWLDGVRVDPLPARRGCANRANPDVKGKWWWKPCCSDAIHRASRGTCSSADSGVRKSSLTTCDAHQWRSDSSAAPMVAGIVWPAPHFWWGMIHLPPELSRKNRMGAGMSVLSADFSIFLSAIGHPSAAAAGSLPAHPLRYPIRIAIILWGILFDFRPDSGRSPGRCPF